MIASGFNVAPNVVESFDEMKLRKAASYIIFKIAPETHNIIVESKGLPGGSC